MKYDLKMYDELERGLSIDRDDLDTELIRQANQFFHASEGAAYAESIKDKEKFFVEKVYAELDNDIRDTMTSDGERVTEDKVKQQINREQDYQAAFQSLLKAGLDHKRWEALKNAYRMRGEMLKGLVSLHNSNYFGEVTGAGERRDSRERLRSRL